MTSSPDSRSHRCLHRSTPSSHLRPIQDLTDPRSRGGDARHGIPEQSHVRICAALGDNVCATPHGTCMMMMIYLCVLGPFWLPPLHTPVLLWSDNARRRLSASPQTRPFEYKPFTCCSAVNRFSGYEPTQRQSLPDLATTTSVTSSCADLRVLLPLRLDLRVFHLLPPSHRARTYVSPPSSSIGPTCLSGG